MARPRKEGMDYFPHDVTLSADKKVEALRILHGNDGYAFYCIMLENIYQEPNFELEVSDAETLQILAKKVEVTPQKLTEMIKTSVKHGCFDRERYLQDGVLTSNGIKKRAEVVLKKRIAMRDSHGGKVSDKVSDAETTPEMPQSKRKVKVKAIKKQYAETVLMTEEEYQKLVTERGETFTKRCIEVLDNYKASKGATYKNDYRAILNWVVERVEEEKNKGFRPTNKAIIQYPTVTTTEEEREQRAEALRKQRERNLSAANGK